MQPIKVNQTLSEDLLVCTIEGDFDSRSAGMVKDEIRKSINEGNNRILIDLTGVTYIDSAGLGTLVSIFKAARENDGDMWVAGPTSQVKMVLELTRLERVFQIYNSMEDALQDLQKVGASETGE